MKILSSEERKKADQFTIETEPISSIDLMERASLKCCDWIIEHFSTETHFHIICGTGNNGGDGLAIARLLKSKGYSIKISILRLSAKGSADFEQNYSRLDKNKTPVSNFTLDEKIKIEDGEIVVDAIFGSGLNKPLEGKLKTHIQSINDHASCIISVDVPSGLFMDKLNTAAELSIFADYTLTFQCPPLSFMFSENHARIGSWSLLDIGLSTSFIENSSSSYEYIEASKLEGLLLKRGRHDYKGSYGHALLCVGSTEKGGAAILSSKAAMRSGLGLLTVGVPKEIHTSLQIAVPEAMTKVLGKDNLESSPDLELFNAIGVGPGIGENKQTMNFLKVLIQNAKSPVVFDADAINIIAQNKTWLSYLPKGSIITPHIGEFKRLILNSNNSIDRLNAQIEFSRKFQVVVVLKGAHTQISLPDGRVFFNSTGNPGMGTAGSGDVLTGLITGLVARGYNTVQAAILGVFLHGEAGDIAAAQFGEESMKAGDIVDCIPKAILKMS